MAEFRYGNIVIVTAIEDASGLLYRSVRCEHCGWESHRAYFDFDDPTAAGARHMSEVWEHGKVHNLNLARDLREAAIAMFVERRVENKLTTTKQ